MAPLERPVLRYRRNQRVVHAVLATSFLLLLITGMMLLWGPASRFAGGGTSRLVHRIAALGYMSVPIGYLLADRAGAIELVRESFRYDRDDIAWFKHMYRYALGRTREMPPQGRLNAGQKLHHAFVIVVSIGVVGTGLTLWFLKSSLGPDWLAFTTLMHDLCMLGLTLFLVGHLYFTYVYKALSGMTTGYIDEAEARLEHSKWLDEITSQQRKGMSQ